ncbi:3-keto-disaccharide hydrolase [Fibrella arboris]|uniref:3-keto-disaccharide hydrolase n=1 Tax=Fibrella arboris TaxID=3242486 RepID=UPI00352036D9
MRQLTITISFLFIASLGLAQKVSQKDWIQLFNGKDLTNWQVKITGHPLNDNYGNTFRVVNGNMAVNYDQYTAFDEQYGHIFYKKPFSAYLLVVEYRFVGQQVKGGPGWAIRNSGAMLHAQDPKTMGLKQDFPISLETQFLGGDGQHERHTANLCTPGTNVMLDGKLFTPHCIDSKSKTYAGEQWVRAEMLVLGDSLVQHIMDGDTVLSYTKPQIGGGNVSQADPAVKIDGKPLKEGYIALQSESHPVEFRKVSLFNLAPYMNKPKQLASVLQQLTVRK